MPERIFVYADWNETAPVLLGTLHSRRLAGSERMEFEYARAVLQTIHTQIAIDPRIQPYEGRQYPARNCFGCVSDSSPDRWGRLLMDRRLERDKRAGVVPQDARLFDSDYLIGVHDAYRVGGCVSKWRKRERSLTTMWNRPPHLWLACGSLKRLRVDLKPERIGGSGAGLDSNAHCSRWLSGRSEAQGKRSR